MPNGTTKSFPESTPPHVIRQAQADMIAEMKASPVFDGFNFSKWEPTRKVTVTQNASESDGLRPVVPPPTHVPTYPAYISDGDEKAIDAARAAIARRMDQASVGAKAGAAAAARFKRPVTSFVLGAIGAVANSENARQWVLDHSIAEHNRQTARIYNGIGNNALKQRGGLR